MSEPSGISEAVAPIRSALEADGYELHVEPSSDGTVLSIVAGPEACEDCLIPATVLEPMIAQALRERGLGSVAWSLRYPSHQP